MNEQRTIEKEVSLQGIGLHTGKKTTLVFRGAPEDTGIIFVRKDLPGSPTLKAEVQNAYPRTNSTALKNGDAEVFWVEHVLAAIGGLDIDNLIVELDNIEPPAIDGSAIPFYNLLREAGICSQKAAKEYTVVKYPIWVEEKDASLMVTPSPSLRISYILHYQHPLVNSQFASFFIDEGTFEKEIAPARTFGFYPQAMALKEKGLARGGSLDNAIIIDEDKILNESLRFENEFVRHKILDIIGDLKLLGNNLKGHLLGVKSGHALNLKLVSRIKEVTASRGEGLSPTALDEEGMDCLQIQEVLPHRHPFIFVDRILKLEKYKRVVGLKNVSITESFFQGHFPGNPVMPAVLILETMAQVAGVLMLSRPENRGKLAYFMSVEKAKFRHPVVPGDQLIIEAKVIRAKSKTVKVDSQAFVRDHLVAEAQMMFALAKDSRQ